MKKYIYIFIVIFFLIFSYSLQAQDVYSVDTIQVILIDSVQNNTINFNKEWPQFIKVGKQHLKNPLYIIVENIVGKRKTTTILLTLLTGPLGGHRLYLGTKPIVPIFYVLTLGGGIGVLPFIDLIVICFSNDISRFENNEKIFMWAK